MKFSALRISGLTLLEVLIALAILSIALTAIIQATAQNIKDTLYLQNKTIATWVGTRIINEIRVGVIKVPNSTTQQTEALGRTFTWQAKWLATPNPRIKEINVSVSLPPNEIKLAQLVSYVYVAP